MVEIPVKWSFKLQAVLHILQIVGYCNNPECESILINQAVSWIEKAQSSFRAQIISVEPQLPLNSELTVSCQLIFQNKEDLNDFLGYIADLYGFS